jgi:hypothetical protein
MGNNAAYSSFEHTIVTIYNHGILTLELLDELAKDYEGMDVDAGGSRDLQTKDGKTLKEVCIGLVDPAWVPVKTDGPDDYDDPEEWEWEEKYGKWNEITDERWGWR